MSSLFSLLKLLCVPVIAAALNQALLWGLRQYGYEVDMQMSMLTNTDKARAGFVSQATFTLLMTLFVGLPFFRYCARKKKAGFGNWLLGWTIVHAPTGMLSIVAVALGGTLWPLLTLIISMVVVASLWWHLFYAELPATASNSPQ